MQLATFLGFRRPETGVGDHLTKEDCTGWDQKRVSERKTYLSSLVGYCGLYGIRGFGLAEIFCIHQDCRYMCTWMQMWVIPHCPSYHAKYAI